MDILDQRALEDAERIQSTMNTQLLPMIKQILGIGDDTLVEFKFITSDLEKEQDDDMEEAPEAKEVKKED